MKESHKHPVNSEGFVSIVSTQEDSTGIRENIAKKVGSCCNRKIIIPEQNPHQQEA
jgi:hypothetical protein